MPTDPTTITWRVSVFHVPDTHTRDAWTDGFKPGTPERLVWGAELTASSGLTGMDVAEVVYAITNSYPEELHGAAASYPIHVESYRAERLRSLSIGDVVHLIHPRWRVPIILAVASAGFEVIDARDPAWQL